MNTTDIPMSDLRVSVSMNMLMMGNDQTKLDHTIGVELLELGHLAQVNTALLQAMLRAADMSCRSFQHLEQPQEDSDILRNPSTFVVVGCLPGLLVPTHSL